MLTNHQKACQSTYFCANIKKKEEKQLSLTKNYYLCAKRK